MTTLHRNNTGFSLVELSVILVILGLLVGAVMSGISILRSSELRTVGIDAQKYMSAINAFAEKHQAIPGDMNNATAIWGAAHATPATCQTTSSSGNIATCDGDGNGKNGDSAGTIYENFRAWQHLKNAGLLEINVTGVAGSGGTGDSVIGTNVPQSKIKGAGFSFDYIGPQFSTTENFDGDYGNALYFGAEYNNDVTKTAILKSREAATIDTKFDDGRPASGFIRGVKNTSAVAASCTNGATSAAIYNLSLVTIVCPLLIITGL